ncbi:MAG: DUF58 domain-containing protein [Xenococcaceae cyanobacterium]
MDTKLTMAYQLFTFLFSLLILAIVFSLRFSLRFDASRILPRFTTVGVKVRYSITIHNRTNKIQNGLKLWENWADTRPSSTEFKEAIELFPKQHNFIDRAFIYYRWLKLIARKQLATAKTVDLPTLLPNSATKVVVEIEPLHRGVLWLTGITIARPDPFGLFYACKTISLPQPLLILPKRYHLPPIQLPGLRRCQSGSIALASSVGDAEEFISLRDYRPRDSLRKIHWKGLAKTDKLMVKQEQEEFFVRHALILDTFQEAKYSEILEKAISVAASFACDVQTQESLLDLIFVGFEAYCFTSGRGLGTTDKILEILASVTACQDKSFDYLTQAVTRSISKLSGCICIFICWDETRKELVNYLQKFGIPTLILVITDDRAKNDDLYSENLHWLELGKIQEGLMNI